MWLGEKSISNLDLFLHSFKTGLQFGKSEVDWKNFSSFTDYVAQHFELSLPTPNNWRSIILQEHDNEEEKSFDFFFALFKEFKLEKEDLHNE
jgi:hypothetical protein